MAESHLHDEVSASFWEFNLGMLQRHQEGLTQDISKATMSIRYQDEVVLESISEWCAEGLWELEYQSDILKTNHKRDYEISEWWRNNVSERWSNNMCSICSDKHSWFFWRFELATLEWCSDKHLVFLMQPHTKWVHCKTEIDNITSSMCSHTHKGLIRRLMLIGFKDATSWKLRHVLSLHP